MTGRENFLGQVNGKKGRRQFGWELLLPFLLTEKSVCSAVRYLIFQFDFLFEDYASCHVTDNVDAGCTHIAECIDTDVNAHNSCRQTCHGCEGCEGCDGTSRDTWCSYGEEHICQKDDEHHGDTYVNSACISEEHDHE